MMLRVWEFKVNHVQLSGMVDGLPRTVAHGGHHETTGTPGDMLPRDEALGGPLLHVPEHAAQQEQTHCKPPRGDDLPDHVQGPRRVGATVIWAQVAVARVEVGLVDHMRDPEEGVRTKEDRRHHGAQGQADHDNADVPRVPVAPRPEKRFQGIPLIRGRNGDEIAKCWTQGLDRPHHVRSVRHKRGHQDVVEEEHGAVVDIFLRDPDNAARQCRDPLCRNPEFKQICERLRRDALPLPCVSNTRGQASEGQQQGIQREKDVVPPHLHVFNLTVPQQSGNNGNVLNGARNHKRVYKKNDARVHDAVDRPRIVQDTQRGIHNDEANGQRQDPQNESSRSLPV
mmetsp:Transcript_610/g.1621  ORF Transcript_610/g.1621 Transcript_610/m.1621 type:complete len:340 (+) Transcript_610:731-1750(+)